MQRRRRAFAVTAEEGQAAKRSGPNHERRQRRHRHQRREQQQQQQPPASPPAPVTGNSPWKLMGRMVNEQRVMLQASEHFNQGLVRSAAAIESGLEYEEFELRLQVG